MSGVTWPITRRFADNRIIPDDPAVKNASPCTETGVLYIWVRVWPTKHMTFLVKTPPYYNTVTVTWSVKRQITKQRQTPALFYGYQGKCTAHPSVSAMTTNWKIDGRLCMFLRVCLTQDQRLQLPLSCNMEFNSILPLKIIPPYTVSSATSSLTS